MALPPKTYEQARIKARLHVQIQINSIDEKVEKLCLKFPITGKIVRVFRGKRICQVGEIVKFDVAVLGEFEECPPSGVSWLRYPDLLYNEYMEVYLNGKPPNCSVALYEYTMIKAPTEKPIIPCPGMWWQFWQSASEI